MILNENIKKIKYMIKMNQIESKLKYMHVSLDVANPKMQDREKCMPLENVSSFHPKDEPGHTRLHYKSRRVICFIKRVIKKIQSTLFFFQISMIQVN